MADNFIRWNPIELLNDLLATGMSKEDAYVELRKERRKRIAASNSQIKSQNDNSLQNHGGIV